MTHWINQHKHPSPSQVPKADEIKEVEIELRTILVQEEGRRNEEKCTIYIYTYTNLLLRVV